jgi:hypothetical protein
VPTVDVFLSALPEETVVDFVKNPLLWVAVLLLRRRDYQLRDL